MQNIISPGISNSFRQMQMRQHLSTVAIDARDTVKRGTVDETHPGTGSIDAIRLLLVHLPLQLLEIQPGCRWFLSKYCMALAMDDVAIVNLAINLIVNLVVFIRQQRNVHLTSSTHHQRLRPNYIAQFQKSRLRLFRPSLFYRCPCHLQICASRQHFFPRSTVCLHLMISQEERLSGERRAIALPSQIRSVAVQQRVQDSSDSIVFSPLATCRINPIALSSKRIGGQIGTPRLTLAVQFVPIYLQPPDP